MIRRPQRYSLRRHTFFCALQLLLSCGYKDAHRLRKRRKSFRLPSNAPAPHWPFNAPTMPAFDKSYCGKQCFERTITDQTTR